MDIKIEGNYLIIKAPIADEPRASSTGKSLVVASSEGALKTGLIVKGKPLTITFSAFIKKD